MDHLVLSQPQDLEQIAQLFNAYRIFYKQSSDLNAATQFIQKRLQQQDSKIFVYKKDNQIFGFTQLYPTYSSISMKHAWILNDLYVDEQHRQKGVAEALMQHAIEFAKHTDAAYISLETCKTNLKAQALYKKLGFVPSTDMLFLSLTL